MLGDEATRVKLFLISYKILSVLTMMDSVLTEPEKGPIKSFVEELYNHSRHGNRKDCRTRHAKSYEN